jgi:hypothetical protein
MYVDYGYNAHDNEDKALDAALAKFVGFNPADLANNRAGRISTKQMLALTYKGIVPLLGLIIPLLGLMVLAGTFYLFGPWIMHRVFLLIKVGGYLMMGLGALLLGVLALLANAVIASRRLLLLTVDLAMGKSAQAVGKVTVSHSDDIEDGIDQILRKRTLMYYFVQSGRSFQVPKEAYDELRAIGGAGYFTLHFTPRSHFLLALEPYCGGQTAAEQDRAA